MLLFDNTEIVFVFSLFHLSHPFPSNERRDSLTRSPTRKLFGEWEAAVVKATRSR